MCLVPGVYRLNETDSLGLEEFLQKYPQMAIVPSGQDGIVLSGILHFSARVGSTTDLPLEDRYRLKIICPKGFPFLKIPKVLELDKKIPQNGKFHVNPDNTLCLGSPLRLRIIINKYPTILGFVSKLLIPYLYSVSRILNGSAKSFDMGELEHGETGIIEDYKSIFKLSSREQVISTLKLLGIRRRLANKKKCPCNCSFRLGKCNKRFLLNDIRSTAPRKWFREHINTLGQVPG